jgi:SNF2 family DNA or RNA helicase
MEQIALREYQERALKQVSHLASFGLFMGTGSGKTITSIARIKQNPIKKLLIICPHNVKTQWKETLEKYYPKFKILEFNKNSNAKEKKKLIYKEEYDVLIVNYEIVYKLGLENLIDDTWQIILDESHRIKNAKAKTTKAVLKIGEKTIYKIILTATPTQGNYGGYVDYYSQLFFLGYMEMDYKKFRERYVKEKEVVFTGNKYATKVISGYRNTQEIDDILKVSCVRYVAKYNDFDPQHIRINLKKPKNYNERIRVYKNLIIKNMARKRLALKTICTGTIIGKDYYDESLVYKDNSIKIDWLEDFLQDTNEVVAIYYQYNVELEQLETLMKKLNKKYIVVNGETKDKYKEVNHKDYEVMLGQYQSAGTGIDGLHLKCHIEVLFAMPESSLIYTQTIGRIDRDGQTKVPMYYYLICEKTIEEKIYNMIEQKIEFSEETLDKLVI